MTAVLDRWQSAFEGATRGANEPAWLLTRRHEALARFRQLGFPTPRDEAWRTLDLGDIVKTSWTPAGRPTPGVLEKARARLQSCPSPTDEAARVVLLNGHFEASLSDVDRLPDGLRVSTQVETSLGSLVSDADHAFAALNAALFPDALCLEVADGVEVAAPLHLLSLAIGGEGALASHPRLFARLGRGARASLLATWLGDAQGPFFSNTVVEMRLLEGAHLDWLDVQRLPNDFQHLVSLGAALGRDAFLAGACLQLGAGLVRQDMNVRLDEEGAGCRLDGATIVSGRQHVDVLTNVDHAVPHCTSAQLWKSILDGRSSTAFSGRILVRPNAQKTDAQQANHSILLSRDAVSDSVPKLEIFADDVKCAHGATVGQLDDEALFYLRSRGLGVEQAQAMLVHAFAGEVADRIQQPSLAAHAHDVLQGALGSGEGPAR